MEISLYLSKQLRWKPNFELSSEDFQIIYVPVTFFFKLPVEDLCSLTSQSLPVEPTSIVPESTEDILFTGFTSLGMKEERIETAQQVNGSMFLKDVLAVSGQANK
jgi:hypothetical protein